MKYGFGWRRDKLDHRDIKYSAYPIQVKKPIDLREHMPVIYDQGQTSSCVANATAAAFEYVRMAQTLPDWIPSRLFIYWLARSYEGSTITDDGSQIRDAVKAVSKVGAPSEKIWPFSIDHVNTRPTVEAFNAAKHSMILSYDSVPQKLEHILSCLTHNGPVLFGSSVFSEIQTTTDGYIPMPGPDEQPIGGHAMLIVGWQPDTQRFIIRNSWSESWGDKGYGYMDAAYILNESLTDDLWVLWKSTRD